MDTIVVGTPLRYTSVSKPYTFADGVTILKIDPSLWKTPDADKLISNEDRQHLSNSLYWLSLSKRVNDWRTDWSDYSLYEKVRRAMYALQIICPCGGLNLYVKFRVVPNGLEIIGSQRPAQMLPPLTQRIAVPEQQGLQNDFEVIHRDVNRAFDEGIIRLQNPIYLLEHGLQINHVYLSTLMWVMGLDMLFMAGHKALFVERIAGFLGACNPVFSGRTRPAISPELTIRSASQHVYELRNFVAHGRKIPAKPFLEKCDFLNANGTKLSTTDSRYSQAIMESALILLCNSLRKVMLNGLVDIVKNESSWRQQLKSIAGQK